MELSLPHTLHIFNIFRKYDGKENCAQLIEEEFNRMFGINDVHDCNVVSMNSLNIQNSNDYCTSHEKNVSYKHVIFVECIKFVKTCLVGKIDCARSISMIEPIICSK